MRVYYGVDGTVYNLHSSIFKQIIIHTIILLCVIITSLLYLYELNNLSLPNHF